MANVDPARFANQQEALHPHFPDYHGPPPPRKKRIRTLIRLITGRPEKKDPPGQARASSS
jgi:hypothetical protein